MDPSQEFAQALLDQLRRDLKRFARERRDSLFEHVARPDPRRYFREVDAGNLQVADALGLMRGLGFTPLEYLSRLQGRSRPVPLNPSGFMARHAVAPELDSDLSRLLGLLPWARELAVTEGAEEVELDLESRLRSLGLCPPFGRRRIVRFIFYLFMTCSDQRLTELAPEAVPGLIRSVLLLLQALPMDEANLGAMAQVIDVGFHFERFVDDLALRGELFVVAAQVSAALGFAHDASWCSRQAMRLAALAADWELLERARTLVARLGCEAPVGDLEGLCRTLRTERRFVHLAAPKLDLLAGGARAFTNATSGRRPMTVSRWLKLDVFLSTHVSCLERSTAGTVAPMPRVSGIFPCLKLDPDHRPACPMLVKWVKAVSVREASSTLNSIPGCLREADQGPWLDQTLRYFDELSTRGPAHLNKEDAIALCRGLLNVTYHFKGRGRLNDAADFIDMAFRLIDQLEGRASLLAYAYRMATNLCIDLGNLIFAEVFAQRSSALEALEGDPEGLSLSLYFEGFVLYLQGNLADSQTLWMGCCRLLSQSPSRSRVLPLEFVHLALAKLCLSLGDSRQALDYLRPLELYFQGRDRNHAEFLLVKAECCSLLGMRGTPLEVLEEATTYLDPDDHVVDLLLIELGKCKHLVRIGERQRAADIARSLIGLGSRLKTNPVGLRAIQEIARAAFSTDSLLATDAFESVQRKIQYPNL